MKKNGSSNMAPVTGGTAKIAFKNTKGTTQKEMMEWTMGSHGAT